MNQEIEQRIVAMYFDNKDFEKNAKETIETLGELRDNLNLEDSVKGFEELDKAGKKLNLNNVKSNINNMKNSLSGFQNVLNKAFSIGTAPVRALENFFGTFQSYVGKFVGFDLASKFVNSLENALRQLTVAPIEAGWSMYESTIDSVKTIMSGTMESYKKTMSETNADWTYDEEEHMKFVKGQLNELSRYAQQTVFSLSDMTSNVGKFTNNNVDLETAVTAMEGIANMTAKAGQGAQQASMAMYNFSQAIGVGKMTTIDWKSIENANIATTEMKNLMMEAAVATGTLQKKVEKIDGKEVVKFYRTVDKEGRKLAQNKWEEVSVEKFRDSLQSGWLDKDTMLAAMKIYSGEINDVDTLEAMGFNVKENPELAEMLFEIGRSAKEAAAQVRTFSKMWDALTESVQSGWADSMQLIFGDLYEATDFWTRINDELDSVLSKSAEERNNMLHEWRGEVYNSEKEIWEKQEGAYDGRKDLIQGIYNMIAAAKALGGAFSSAWTQVFGKMDGKGLQEITRRFRELSDQFNQWLGVRGPDGEARIEKIQRGLRGVFSILKAVGNVFKTVFGIVKKVAAPMADFFVNLFADVAGFFDGLGDLNAGQVIAKLREGLGKVWEAIARLFEPEEIYDEFGKKTGKKKTPIAKFLESTFGSIRDDVKAWFQDNDLSGVWKALEDAWEWLKGIWEKIASWEGWAAIGAFFTNIYTAVKEYFAPQAVSRQEGNATVWSLGDSKFVSDMKRIWERIKSVWNTVRNWEGWTSIGQFFSNVGGWISKYFNIAVDWFRTPTDNGETGFGNWLNSIKAKFEGYWAAITEWEGWEKIGQFFSNITAFVSDRANATVEWFSEPTANGETGFTNWLNDVLIKLDAFWQPIRDWEGWTEIGNFFSDIWSGIEAFAGTTIDFFTTPTDNGETGFSNWLNSIKTTFETAWNDVIGWEGWTAIGMFFSDIASWISDQFGFVVDWFTKPTDDTGSTGFSQWIDSVRTTFETAWNAVATWEGWASIGQFFTDVGDWIQIHFGYICSWFSKPTANGKTGFVTWLEQFAADVSHIWGVISNWKGWEAIGQFFSDIFGWIMGLFGGGEDDAETEKQTKGRKAGKISLIKEKAKVAKDEVKDADKELSFFERILTAISSFINNISTALTGQDMEKVTKFFEALGTFFNGLLDIVTMVLESVGRFFSATAEGGLGAGLTTLNDSTKGTAVWALVIAAVIEILDLIKTRWMSKIDAGESVAHKLFELGAAMLMVALALGVISLIPIEKIIAGGAVLAVILFAMKGISANLAEAAKQNATTPTERVLSKLIGAVEKMGTIAIVMALLPAVIKAFAEAKAIAPDMTGLDIAAILIGIAGAVAGFMIGFAVVNKLIGNSKANWGNSGTVAKLAVWMLAIIAVIGILGYAADQWIGTKTVLESLQSAKEVLTLAGQAIGGFIGGFIGGIIEPIRAALGYRTPEQQMEESMKILTSIGDRMDYFTPDKISGINRILSSVGMLTQTIREVPDSGKIIAFAEALDPMTTAIMKMGISLAGFTEQDPGAKDLSINDVEANILKMAEIVRSFSIPRLEATSATNFIRTIRTLATEMTDADYQAFGDISAKFIKSFNEATAPYSETMREAGGDLLTNLSSALRIGMGNGSLVGSFDAQPVVDAIVLAIGAGRDRVATEVHEMIQGGIDSSPEAGGEEGFDLSGLVGMDPTSLFNFGGENGFNWTSLLGKDSDQLLSQFSTVLYGQGGTEENPQKNSIFGMLGGLSTYADNLEMPDIDDTLGKITEKLTFKDEEGNEIDLATYLQQNLNQMSEALKNAEETFTITIIPTIDWSNLTAESIRNQLGDMPIDYPINLSMPDKPIKIDYTGLSAELGLNFIQDQLVDIENAIDADRVQVVEAVNNMGTRIDNVSTSIRALKLYLDTGALVGGITPYVDLALGRRARLAERLGVSIP